MTAVVFSPGSRRTDTKVKPSEYAEAGIPHYWVSDLDEPFPVRIDLTELPDGPARRHGEGNQ